MVRGMLRAVAPPGGPIARRAGQLTNLPRLVRGMGDHAAASCEVARMLSARLGLPSSIGELFSFTDERWDGKGIPGRTGGEGIPLPMRIVQVARDATFQCALDGPERAASVISERASHAFDPEIARTFVDHARDILPVEEAGSLWDVALACEPEPRLVLNGHAIDRALTAMGDFADLASRYLAGHTAMVARLAATAGEAIGLDAATVCTLRRAALVHDIGRVAVPVRIWNHPAPLSADDWEQVRLHAYHAERVLSRSPMLATLAPIATHHHERLDGSGYHRGATAPALARPSRVLAAADAGSAMTEPRPHRAALPAARAALELQAEANAGRLDPDAVAAVIEAMGQPPPAVERPAGLTDREATVIGLLARGLQTKQIAGSLGISAKTADRHIQNSYAKIGVSTRAAATLFAMEHGLVAWGELPIPRSRGRS